MSDALERMYDEAMAKYEKARDAAWATDGPPRKWTDTVSVTWGLLVHEGHTLYVPAGFGPVTVVESRFVTKPVMVNADALKAAVDFGTSAQDTETPPNSRV